jgi:ribosome-associated protein
MTNQTIQSIEITELPIRLGQFLKLAGLVQNGNEAKMLIQNGEVTHNGQIETRRGRQLAIDDLIGVEGNSYRVVARLG